MVLYEMQHIGHKRLFWRDIDMKFISKLALALTMGAVAVTPAAYAITKRKIKKHLRSRNGIYLRVLFRFIPLPWMPEKEEGFSCCQGRFFQQPLLQLKMMMIAMKPVFLQLALKPTIRILQKQGVTVSIEYNFTELRKIYSKRCLCL